MEGAMHVLITLRFVGTRYHGFQVQKNALSVCEVLQNALQRLYGTRPPVKGCSRTDAGVHALGYCVSYFQPKPIEPRRLPLAVNRFLPEDIRVTAAYAVPEGFHALAEDWWNGYITATDAGKQLGVSRKTFTRRATEWGEAAGFTVRRQ